MKSISILLVFFIITLSGFSQTYTFIGNGNWSIASNWSNNAIPPATLPAGDTIYISPASGDSAILNVSQIISEGAFFIVSTGANFTIHGNLTIKNSIPSLTTIAVSNISTNTAISGGSIISTGGNPIIEYGVVWSTTPNPTILNSKTINTVLSNTYISNISSLKDSTTYYIRAYATNNIGTAYGNEIIFTTISIPSISICNYVWMKRNLDVVTYKNGDTIPNVTDPTKWANLTTGAWCYYNNDPANGAIYGKLYNWYAVNDPRGLAPEGWMIPSDFERDSLSTCLGGPYVAADKLKEQGTAHWTSPNTSINSTSFTALPSGGRDNTGSFSEKGKTAIWWTIGSRVFSNTDTLDIEPYNFPPTSYNEYSVTIISGTIYSYYAYNKNNGYAVRCIKKYGLPELYTIPIDSISNSSAISGGVIINDGGHPIISKGIIWSKHNSPKSYLSTKSNNRSETQTYLANMTDLSPEMKYFVRAYATNSIGTTYGNELSFTSAMDTGLYPGVKICNQFWMKKNLDLTKYRNGDIIPKAITIANWQSATDAWGYYNNDPSNDSSYGKLYTWYAVNDPRGLAPQGWHIPTKSEWDTLRTCLNASDIPGGNETAGTKLKEPDTTHWLSPNDFAAKYYINTNFRALPGGRIAPGPSSGEWISRDMRTLGWWWCTDLANNNFPYATSMKYNDGTVTFGSSYQTNGHSVRCLKNTKAVLTTYTPYNISANSAISGATIISDGSDAIISKGMVWSTVPNPTINLETKTNDGSGNNSYSSFITGLQSNTTYYVRAYATNSIGTGYGDQTSFTTSAFGTPPSVTTTVPYSNTFGIWISGGYVYSDGGSQITQRGSIWSINPNPDFSNGNYTSDGTGIGNYNSTLTGLTPNTIYYVRAYAANILGGFMFSNVYSFKTPG